jgi:hypothetical protein
MTSQTAPWRIAAASVPGASHIAADTPCQDAHRALMLGTLHDPILVIAVADGAGSARASEIGAGIAVGAICAQAETWFASVGPGAMIGRDLMAAWFWGAREEIAARAAEAESNLSDFACTLLVTVIGQKRAAFAQIGDGAMVVPTQERNWAWVFWPQHGPYANTTQFVTDHNMLELIEFEAREDRIEEVAVFSDGLERMVLDHAARAAHGAFFDRMFPPLRASVGEGIDEALSQHLAAYLGSPTVAARTDDDVTLVLA